MPTATARIRMFLNQSGVAAASQSYCLTALVSDFDDDGWPDIFVACDQTPSLLYMNQHDGTFSEEAVLRGAAFNDRREGDVRHGRHCRRLRTHRPSRHLSL